MSKKQGGPPRFLTTVAWLATLAVLALVVLAALKIGSAFRGGLEQVGERRARDAAQVTAEKEAGEAYIGNLPLSLAVLPPAEGMPGKLGFNFTIANTGQKEVLKAAAEVSIADRDKAKPRHGEKMVLFDASGLSVRSDQPLAAGEERNITIFVEAGADWNTDDVQCRVSEARIEVRVEAAKD